MLRSKDGHLLYEAICSRCGISRGLQVRRDLHRPCRSCGVNLKSSFKNAEKARLAKHLKFTKTTTFNVDDFIVVNGTRKYRAKCKTCFKDRGYKQSANATQNCRSCMSSKNKKTDAQKRIRANMKSNLYHRLRKRYIDKKDGTFKILGYSVKALMDHLESKFQPGMTWDNQGKWHIDHIIPDSHFKYSSAEDESFKKCWALDNLQPLWAIDNIRKSNKLEE